MVSRTPTEMSVDLTTDSSFASKSTTTTSTALKPAQKGGLLSYFTPMSKTKDETGADTPSVINPFIEIPTSSSFEEKNTEKTMVPIFPSLQNQAHILLPVSPSFAEENAQKTENTHATEHEQTGPRQSQSLSLGSSFAPIASDSVFICTATVTKDDTTEKHLGGGSLPTSYFTPSTIITKSPAKPRSQAKTKSTEESTVNSVVISTTDLDDSVSPTIKTTARKRKEKQDHANLMSEQDITNNIDTHSPNPMDSSIMHECENERNSLNLVQPIDIDKNNPINITASKTKTKSCAKPKNIMCNQLEATETSEPTEISEESSTATTVPIASNPTTAKVIDFSTSPCFAFPSALTYLTSSTIFRTPGCTISSVLQTRIALIELELARALLLGPSSLLHDDSIPSPTLDMLRDILGLGHGLNDTTNAISIKNSETEKKMTPFTSKCWEDTVMAPQAIFSARFTGGFSSSYLQTKKTSPTLHLSILTAFSSSLSSPDNCITEQVIYYLFPFLMEPAVHELLRDFHATVSLYGVVSTTVSTDVANYMSDDVIDTDASDISSTSSSVDPINPEGKFPVAHHALLVSLVQGNTLPLGVLSRCLHLLLYPTLFTSSSLHISTLLSDLHGLASSSCLPPATFLLNLDCSEMIIPSPSLSLLELEAAVTLVADRKSFGLSFSSKSPSFSPSFPILPTEIDPCAFWLWEVSNAALTSSGLPAIVKSTAVTQKRLTRMFESLCKALKMFIDLAIKPGQTVAKLAAAEDKLVRCRREALELRVRLEKDAKVKAEKDAKEMKSRAEKEAKEAKLKAEREAKESLLRAEKEAKEAALRADKEAKEAKLRAEKEAKEAKKEAKEREEEAKVREAERKKQASKQSSSFLANFIRTAATETTIGSEASDCVVSTRSITPSSSIVPMTSGAVLSVAPTALPIPTTSTISNVLTASLSSCSDTTGIGVTKNAALLTPTTSLNMITTTGSHPKALVSSSVGIGVSAGKPLFQPFFPPAYSTLAPLPGLFPSPPSSPSTSICFSTAKRKLLKNIHEHRVCPVYYPTGESMVQMTEIKIPHLRSFVPWSDDDIVTWDKARQLVTTSKESSQVTLSAREEFAFLTLQRATSKAFLSTANLVVREKVNGKKATERRINNDINNNNTSGDSPGDRSDTDLNNDIDWGADAPSTPYIVPTSISTTSSWATANREAFLTELKKSTFLTTFTDSPLTSTTPLPRMSTSIRRRHLRRLLRPFSRRISYRRLIPLSRLKTLQSLRGSKARARAASAVAFAMTEGDEKDATTIEHGRMGGSSAPVLLVGVTKIRHDAAMRQKREIDNEKTISLTNVNQDTNQTPTSVVAFPPTLTNSDITEITTDNDSCMTNVKSLKKKSSERIRLRKVKEKETFRFFQFTEDPTSRTYFGVNHPAHLLEQVLHPARPFHSYSSVNYDDSEESDAQEDISQDVLSDEEEGESLANVEGDDETSEEEREEKEKKSEKRGDKGKKVKTSQGESSHDEDEEDDEDEDDDDTLSSDELDGEDEERDKSTTLLGTKRNTSGDVNQNTIISDAISANSVDKEIVDGTVFFPEFTLSGFKTKPTEMLPEFGKEVQQVESIDENTNSHSVSTTTTDLMTMSTTINPEVLEVNLKNVYDTTAMMACTAGLFGAFSGGISEHAMSPSSNPNSSSSSNMDTSSDVKSTSTSTTTTTPSQLTQPAQHAQHAPSLSSDLTTPSSSLSLPPGAVVLGPVSPDVQTLYSSVYSSVFSSSISTTVTEALAEIEQSSTKGPEISTDTTECSTSLSPLDALQNHNKALRKGLTKAVLRAVTAADAMISETQNNIRNSDYHPHPHTHRSLLRFRPVIYPSTFVSLTGENAMDTKNMPFSVCFDPVKMESLPGIIFPTYQAPKEVAREITKLRAHASSLANAISAMERKGLSKNEKGEKSEKSGKNETKTSKNAQVTSPLSSKIDDDLDTNMDFHVIDDEKEENAELHPQHRNEASPVGAAALTTHISALADSDGYVALPVIKKRKITTVDKTSTSIIDFIPTTNSGTTEPIDGVFMPPVKRKVKTVAPVNQVTIIGENMDASQRASTTSSI